jgi:hypothetical protein
VCDFRVKLVVALFQVVESGPEVAVGLVHGKAKARPANVWPRRDAGIDEGRDVHCTARFGGVTSNRV